MRKLLTLAAVAAMALPVMAFSNAAGPEFTPSGNEVQTISGSIALPTRFPLEPENGYPGLGRNIYNCSRNSNGVITYIAAIDEDTWGGPFVIEDVTAGATTVDPNTGAAQDADIDVYLYGDIADCQPQGASPTTLAEYDTGGPGEVGFIPQGTRYAIIFTATAINSTFTMRIYAPPVIDLSGGDLDLTVASGATVTWRNDTGDYAWVRGDGFDSSPGPSTGIRNGDTFSHTFDVFFGGATFDYETSQGSGTITVVPGPGAGTPS